MIKVLSIHLFSVLFTCIMLNLQNTILGLIYGVNTEFTMLQLTFCVHVYACAHHVYRELQYRLPVLRADLHVLVISILEVSL